MMDYNHYDWLKFAVCSPEKQPTSPHFAAVLFEKRDDWTPPYDQHDPREGTVSTFKYVTYFAFLDKQTLDAWVSCAIKNKMKFFCFEVKKVGLVEVNVGVDV